MSLPLCLAGCALQSFALASTQTAAPSLSFDTRVVHTSILSTLFALGSLLAHVGTPPTATATLYIRPLLLVPLIRVDRLFCLLSSVLTVFLWATKLNTTKILYESDVFPLQVAATIWNDCHPVPAVSYDETSTLRILRRYRHIWTPDVGTLPYLKLPMYVLFSALFSAVHAFERLISRAWRLFQAGRHNATPVPMEGHPRELVGNTMLVSDDQLEFVQYHSMHDAPARAATRAARRAARRVALRSVHLANVLAHPSFKQLHTHSPGGHAMSEYYARVGEHPLLKRLLSTCRPLGVLPDYQWGNALHVGAHISANVMWARLVVGSWQSLLGHTKWRSGIASAMYIHASSCFRAWAARDAVQHTALHRHVHSVTRRWLVDWTMFMWWEIDLPPAAIGDENELFDWLRHLLLDNLAHNTVSLPHAVMELAVSTSRDAVTTNMLSHTVGAGWEQWVRRVDAASMAASSGEFKCAGVDVLPQVTVDRTHYRTQVLKEVVAAGDGDVRGSSEDGADAGNRLRGIAALRIVETLVNGVRQAWVSLPEEQQLLGVADTLDSDNEL